MENRSVNHGHQWEWLGPFLVALNVKWSMWEDSPTLSRSFFLQVNDIRFSEWKVENIGNNGSLCICCFRFLLVGSESAYSLNEGMGMADNLMKRSGCFMIIRRPVICLSVTSFCVSVCGRHVVTSSLVYILRTNVLVTIPETPSEPVNFILRWWAANTRNSFTQKPSETCILLRIFSSVAELRFCCRVKREMLINNEIKY